MTRQQLKDLRWSPERAEEYVRELGVIRGCNYVPAYCYSYIEMWQNYQEKTIERELQYAKKLGLNSFRIFMATCQWQTKKEETYRNLDKFLTMASSMGFSIMMTLQPNRCVLPGTEGKLENPSLSISGRACMTAAGHMKTCAIFTGELLFGMNFATRCMISPMISSPAIRTIAA